MSKKNILIFHNILWSKYKGGVFSAMSKLVLNDQIAIEIVQIAETDKDRIGLSGIDYSYHQYSYELLFSGAYGDVPKFKMLKSLVLKIWRNSSDLILLPGFHTFEYWGMLVACKCKGKAVGVFCDSTEFDKPRTLFKKLLKHLFFSQCDVFFGYGLRSRDYLKANGANPAHIYSRCQAAALPHDYDASIVPQKRLSLSPPAYSPKFLYVGRLSPEKGLDTLLHAYKTVISEIPNSKLVLVGSGPSNSNLQTLASNLGLSDYVNFVGSKDVNALQDDYLSATCLVLPSTSEPWGLVVNEALAYGCPVVVSHRCGCVPELVIEGVTGYPFKAGDIDDLAQKMLTTVKDFADPEATANKCLAVISEYSPEAAARQILYGCKATLARLRPNA